MADFFKEAFDEENSVDGELFLRQKEEARKLFFKKLLFTFIFLAGSFALSLISIKVKDADIICLSGAIPVFLCGILCGGPWGFAAGAISPLLKLIFLNDIPLFPDTVLLCFEFAVFSCLGGYLYKAMPKKLYFAEINALISYLSAKLAYSVVYYFEKMFSENIMTGFLSVFKDSLLTSLPGLIILLAGLPVFLFLFKKFKMIINQ